jgi:hypothetical protein
VIFNRERDQWEIYDTAFDPPQLIMAKPFEGLRELELIPGLCRRLAAARIERTDGMQTMINRAEARNRAILEERERTAKAERLEIVREWAAYVRRHL